MLPSQMPTYIVPRLRTSDVDVIFDLRLMVTLGAIDINERYKILKVDLSEDNANVFLRLQMLGNTSLNVSLPNWGLTLATKANIVSSYLVCRGVSESGNLIYCLNTRPFNWTLGETAQTHVILQSSNKRQINAVTMTHVCFFYLYLQMDLFVDRQFINPDFHTLGNLI
jgi:hypothetical protein